jgi:hypothetical protein
MKRGLEVALQLGRCPKEGIMCRETRRSDSAFGTMRAMVLIGRLVRYCRAQGSTVGLGFYWEGVDVVLRWTTNCEL